MVVHLDNILYLMSLLRTVCNNLMHHGFFVVASMSDARVVGDVILILQVNFQIFLCFASYSSHILNPLNYSELYYFC